MNIAEAILHQYPNADPVFDFRVIDNGAGQSIEYWNVKDSNGNIIPEPSQTDLNNWWIPALQTIKINQLNDKCNQSVLGGFSSSCLGATHNYQFDYDAQMNLNGQLNLLNIDSTITSVSWRTLDAGILSHTKDQFIQLYKDASSFKSSQIDKYWNLKSQVLSATTETQINAINW